MTYTESRPTHIFDHTTTEAQVGDYFRLPGQPIFRVVAVMDLGKNSDFCHYLVQSGDNTPEQWNLTKPGVEEREQERNRAEIEEYEKEMSDIIYSSSEAEIMEALGLIENPPAHDVDDSWLAEPIGANSDAIFGAAAETETSDRTPAKPTRQPQSVTKISIDRNTEKWEVIGDSGKLYTVLGIRNTYGGLALHCSCPAGQNRRACYHVKAVKQADAKRISEENQNMNRGAIAQPDGTVKIDEQFYRAMGDIRQNRGNRGRF